MFCVLTLYIGLLQANTDLISFEHFGPEQGMSQISANAILEDKLGFLWVGTQGGLNRFDGYQFKAFKHDKNDPGSLSSNFINELLEDAAGRLWVGTNGGLNLFDGEQGFTHFSHDSAKPDSLSHDSVW